MTVFSSQILLIASDHAGYTLKGILADRLPSIGWQLQDFGTCSTASCDYPVFAHELCKEVMKTENPGLLICGTGIGMSIAANRHHGIRAALCSHEMHAQACRAHNNANVLCLGERVTAPALAFELVRLFLTTPFEEGRHQHRIELIERP